MRAISIRVGRFTRIKREQIRHIQTTPCACLTIRIQGAISIGIGQQRISAIDGFNNIQNTISIIIIIGVVADSILIRVYTFVGIIGKSIICVIDTIIIRIWVGVIATTIT